MSDLPAVSFASSSNVDEEERQYIVRHLENIWYYGKKYPGHVRVGITMFPDNSWNWHPFYWVKYMIEVSKEDVWSYRAILLAVNQIDGYGEEFTCRSILNKDHVIYLLEKLKPSGMTQYYQNSCHREILTKGFYQLCNFYYNRLLIWHTTYLLGQQSESNRMDVEKMNRIMSNVIGKSLFET